MSQPPMAWSQDPNTGQLGYLSFIDGRWISISQENNAQPMSQDSTGTSVPANLTQPYQYQVHAVYFHTQLYPPRPNQLPLQVPPVGQNGVSAERQHLGNSSTGRRVYHLLTYPYHTGLPIPPWAVLQDLEQPGSSSVHFPYMRGGSYVLSLDETTGIIS